jgi:hypothetical protein
MLDFLELAGLEVDEKKTRRIQQAMNDLLDRQFIHAGDRGSMKHWEILISPRHERIFTAFFEMCGRKFIKNERERWVGVVPDLEAISLPDMRLSQTIVALILALVYQEHVNDGDVESGAVVHTDTAQVFERLAYVLGRERMKASELHDSLKEFKRRGVVAFGDRDDETEAIEIFIRPIVKYIVSNDVTEALRQFAGHEERVLDEAEVAAAPSEESNEDGDHEDGDHEDGDHEDGDHEDGDHEDGGNHSEDAEMA